MKALLAAVLLAGCGFNNQTSGGDDDPGTCTFMLAGEYIDPCMDATGINLDTLTDVTITNPSAVDSGNGEIVGMNVFTPPKSTIVDGIRVIWTKNFTIASTGSLRAYGDMPLAIIATGQIHIDGVLDAGSNVSSKGAGGNPMACLDMMLVAGSGQQCAQHGGSGGGGGGFGEAGGPGGEGGNTHTCDAVDGKPGGLGGKAIVERRPLELRGGCAGGFGSSTNDVGTSFNGPAGNGGGAIALVAAEKITIGMTGKVLAGGGGGQPGIYRAGGGGGGSGGMIFLEAVQVDLPASSMLAANGGAGAGGSENGTGEPGEDGLASIDEADGGEPDGSAGKGGDGGTRDTVPDPGALGVRGGGGGGGGVGIIRIHALTGSRSGDSVVTPAAIVD